MLPSILGKHEDDILYWAGKEVARKFPVFSVDELPEFFQEAGWGLFILKKRLKDEAFYTLKNDFDDKYSKQILSTEAGFIAEQYQKFNGFLTECYGEVKFKRWISLHFQVKWDLKTKIEV